MYQFKQFQFDPQLETLTWDTQSRVLRPKVAQLLTLFLDNPDQLLTREQILTSLWQHSDFRDAALTQSIQELRKVLSDSAQQPQFIKTVPQKGYMWIAEVHNTAPQVNDAKQSSKFWWMLFFVLVVIAVIGNVIWFATSSNTGQGANQISLKNAKTRLIVKDIENLTGLPALDWWGFALQQHMKQIAAPSFDLVEVATQDKLRRTDISFSAKLTQQQQRFILNYQVVHQGQPPIFGQVISEDLHAPVGELAQQLITQLNGKVETLSTELVSSRAPSRQNYFAGLRALSYQGMRSAKPYFEAALVHDQSNQAARLELANILWQMGEQKHAEQLFDAIELSPGFSYLNTRFHLYTGRYWLERLEFARVRSALSKALKEAKALSHQRLLAQAYQLQADLAWLQLDWQTHSKAMHSAKLLMGAQSLSHSESQRAFYLANPPNIGVEQNFEVDMADNLTVVKQAIHYYQRQGQQAQLMASYFALGQNYLAPLDSRERALTTALNMAKTQGNQLLEQRILLYLGFFHIQLHQGEAALHYLEQLNANNELVVPLSWHTQFLIAMANMDIAFKAPLANQSAYGLAQQGFERLLQEEQIDQVTRASAKLLLSWIHISLQQYERAAELAQQATDMFYANELTDSYAYGRYTQMYIQVSQQQYQSALKLLENEPAQKLEALYGAYAYFKLGKIRQANVLIERAKQRFGKQWNADDQRLAQLFTVVTTSQQSHVQIELLPPPFSVYCQSEWTLE